MDPSEGDISESYYFATLFAKCDPQQMGVVKVSVLLSTLRKLKTLAEESCEPCDGAENDSLLELKQELDPKEDDPEITLSKFTEGITSYLRNSSKWNTEDEGQLSENKHVITSEPEVAKSIETGPSGSKEEETDLFLHTEISKLKLQLQKVTDDNVLLRNHITTAQDENCTILQVLDEKAKELKSQAERMKRLEREMNDKNEIICSLEGRNAVLCNKFSQLGNELSTFHKERKKLMTENAHLRQEVKKYLQLLTSKDELVSKITTEAALAEAKWQKREKDLKSHISALNHSIEELNEKVEELEAEYSRLKKSKMETISVETAVSFAEELAMAAAGGNSNSDQQPLSTNSLTSPLPISFSGDHYENFLLSIASPDDIETEMAEAGETQHQLPVVRNCIERFDVATQCEKVEETMSLTSEIQDVPSCPDCSRLMKELDCTNDMEYEDEGEHRLCDQEFIAVEYIGKDDWEGFWKWGLQHALATGFRKPLMCLLAIMIFGFAIFTPMDDGCITNPFIFKNVENYFKHCGMLSHDRVPII